MSKAGAYNLINLVQQILERSERARNDNDYLVGIVYDAIHSVNNDDVPFGILSGRYIYDNRKDLGYPAYESVTRIRRLIQKRIPELRASLPVQQARKKREADFKMLAEACHD